MSVVNRTVSRDEVVEGNEAGKEVSARSYEAACMPFEFAGPTFFAGNQLGRGLASRKLEAAPQPTALMAFGARSRRIR